MGYFSHIVSLSVSRLLLLSSHVCVCVCVHAHAWDGGYKPSQCLRLPFVPFTQPSLILTASSLQLCP